jgi:glycosyltransferase involved in cell wall biosynthesis
VKIVQIVTQMEAGGAQKVAYQLHRELAERGHDSELWFLYTKRPAYSGLAGVISICDRVPSLSDYMTISVNLYSRLRESNPDAVVTHTHYANLLGLTVAAFVGVNRRIAVHHNSLSTYAPAVLVADRILGSIGIYSMIIAISDSVLDSVRDYLPRRIKRIYKISNCVDCSAKPNQTDIHAIFGIPENRPILLSVGRLSKQKNHRRLLESLAQIPDVHLVVVGDGELAEELQQQVRDLGLDPRVTFIGEVGQHQVYELMRSADLFVLPSLWEGLSMAALEAVCIGMASVASDIPSNREAFGDAAVFVPATEVGAMTEGIRRVLENQDLASRLRHNALARARMLSVESMVDDYERLICGTRLRESRTSLDVEMISEKASPR